jgi:serine protease Do
MNHKKNLTISLFLVLAFAFAAVRGDASAFLTDAMTPSPLKDKNKNSAVYELQKAFHEIYEVYKDSVVFISTEKTVTNRPNNPFFNDPFFRDFFGQRGPNGEGRQPQQKQKGLGTGFILTKDGYICTNHHVVDKMDSVTVMVNGKEYKAEIIGSDQLTDIALLKIKGDNNFKPVFLGDSDKVKIGDMSIAIGNPFGLDKTITSGIISATGRKEIDNIGLSHIQTDASINPGNSGGPLINIDGEVIGVNRMIYSNSGGSLGIGFAIPINTAKKVLEELKEHGKVKRGYIGVQISPLTEEYSKELGLEKPDGALVGGIENGGPADKGGLKEGDVIIKLNDSPVTDFRDLLDIVSNSEIGKSIKVTVWRDKKLVNFWVTVSERP